MNQSHLATAADYADAMITARRAKNWLFVLLLLMLLSQLACFFVLRYSNVLDLDSTTTVLTTAPSTEPAMTAHRADLIRQALQYLTAVIDFLGIAIVIILSLVLLLVTNIMLVGRLIGVSRVTGAFVWCILLAVLLFPWQAFFTSRGLSAPEFQIPGVLFTWNDLTQAKFHPANLPEAILKWSRFVGFPVLAVILLLMVQGNSNRGMRLALGETQIPEL